MKNPGKFLIPALVAGLILAAFQTPAVAEEKSFLSGEFSANVGFFTDYVFRGISQTGEDPAVQGGFDYAADNGLYAGVWGSNVDFGDDAQLEIDYYGGHAGDIGGFSYDVGFTYYSYPGTEADLNYWEIAGSAGVDLGRVIFTAGINYSPDNFGGTGDAFYVYSEVEVPLPVKGPVGFALGGTIGYQDISDEIGFGVADYVLWDLGVTASVAGFDLDLRYHDTDVGGGCNICDSRVVFSVSREF